MYNLIKYEFVYKIIFSSRKIYIEIFKKALMLKYTIELDQLTLKILYLEKSNYNYFKIATIKNSKIEINLVNLEEFIKIEILDNLIN